uniref:XS domain-containing protein n=1 Tax=Oryza nivara TaxID=4536 RepID=A0A0E0J3L5_ORYNI
MKSAATSKPKPRPKPPPPPPEASSKASSSSSSAADPNSKRSGPTPTPTPAAAANPTNSANPNSAPLLPSPHPRIPSPHHHLPPQQQQQPPPPPLSRPLLTVAAVEAAMASIPPPPQYGLESLDRRNVVLSDGTVRTYFALPLEPPPQLRQPLPLPLPLPPFPARQLGPPVGLPPPTAERWAPMRPPAALLPMPAPKRKWEGQANGSIPGESSGRQQQQKPEEKRVAKQVKVETPDVDAKQLKSSFLKMVKLMNENAEQKKNYRANGKISQLKCTVCGRDSIDLHSLLNHSYYAKSAELRADHLGLHKALCVLMGWNYSVDPVHKKAYQTLSTADAEANQGDLILWPPTVIIENTYKSKNDGQKDGMSNKEMEGKLREMGFVGASVKPLSGKDGQRSMLVKFASSLAGLSEAERLAQSLEKQGHGRAEWYRVRSVPPGADGGSNPLLVKVGVKGERTWVLYGYLATAWDLDALDLESKQNAVIKSRKELDLSE